MQSGFSTGGTGSGESGHHVPKPRKHRTNPSLLYQGTIGNGKRGQQVQRHFWLVASVRSRCTCSWVVQKFLQFLVLNSERLFGSSCPPCFEASMVTEGQAMCKTRFQYFASFVPSFVVKRVLEDATGEPGGSLASLEAKMQEPKASTGLIYMVRTPGPR